MGDYIIHGPVSYKKKVLIVGAGAAGMACAHHLAEQPTKFDVTVVDAEDYCGGQAFSVPIDKNKFHASWINQGVQGGSYIFHHTMTMFARFGFQAYPVNLQVAFGKGSRFWTNVYPTRLLERHQKEIKRFKRVLSTVRLFEIVFALLPIKYLMKLFRFSSEFANVVVLPMIALFLGTGNYAPEVPSMIMERLCTSPTFGMWYPPDERSVASNLPPMVVFPNLGEFYLAWKDSLEERGVRVRLRTEVTAIVRRDKNGVLVRTTERDPTEDHHIPNSQWVLGETNKLDNGSGSQGEEEEEYDEVVLCVLPDTAKRILGNASSFRERQVLGSAKYADDITVTHCDTDYMKRHYENFFNKEEAVYTLSGVDQTSRVETAKDSFKPMYMIKMYPRDLSKLEMCFDCTNYQAQFPEDVPFEDHVFQTIFLNKGRDSHHWTLDEIDPRRIIRRDWWHQLCHSFTHYLTVVPWMWLLQGRNHIRYAGSWTLVNAHEVAVISGIAAAVNLGAKYPEDLERDKFGFLSFRLYYLLQYGRWYRKTATPEGPGMDWASGLNGSVYRGPGVAGQERLLWRQEQEAGRSTD